MDIKERFRRLFKPRFAVVYPFGIFVVFFSNSNDSSIMAGIWFIIAGLLIRLWANGYAVKMDKLTTCGPYAFVRHPLYVGTTFLVVGFIVMLRAYYAGALLLGAMIIIYYRTIKKEERLLKEKFKDTYLDYQAKVPAMIPTIFPYQQGEKWPFSLKRLTKSREYKVSIWLTIIIIAFHLKDELLMEHEKFSLRMLGLIMIAFALAILDLVSELLKTKHKNTST